MPKDNQQEKFYWVDENDTVLGSITRSEAHDGSLKIHRSVEIVVYNHKNEILLQKRSLKKDTKPGQWTISASGHVDFGESYEHAAQRELLEEVNLTTKAEFVTKTLYQTREQREYMAFFTTKTTQEHIVYDTDEVQEVRWIPISQIHRFIETHTVTEAAILAFQIVDIL